MFIVEKQKEKQSLLKAMIGKKEGKKIMLNEIEALYLKEIKNYNFDVSLKKGKTYFVYRDLRLRNLYPVFYEVKGGSPPVKVYEGKELSIKTRCKSYYLTEDSFIVLEKENKELYEKYWFGQLGIYKNKKGKLHVLDRFEALFLDEIGVLKLTEQHREKLLKGNEDHYKVYSIWRKNSFVLKTGFKFGTDFRIYFPGTSPSNFSHSKHVLHVFPRGFNMRVEELSRAIRVANSVKKTFILAVPSLQKKTKEDFYAFSRDKKPLYMVKCFNQEDKISSKSLSFLLSKAKDLGLKLLIAIVDRESSTTYYEVSKIEIEGEGDFSFYEVKWINP